MLDNSRSASEAVGKPVDWLGLRRREPSARRGARKNQFFPIFVSSTEGSIDSIGDPLADAVDRRAVDVPTGTFAVWPLRPNGEEGLWGITLETSRKYLAGGFLRSRNANPQLKKASINYLPSGTVAAILDGRIEVEGHDGAGAVRAVHREAKGVIPKRVWNMPSHNAETGGSVYSQSSFRGGGFRSRSRSLRWRTRCVSRSQTRQTPL